MSRSALNPVAQLNPLSVAERLGVLGSGAQYLNTYSSVDQGVTNSAVLVRHAELALRLPYSPIGSAIAIRLVAHLNMGSAAANIRYQFSGDEGLAVDATQTRLFGRLEINGVAPQLDVSLALNGTVTGGITSAWTELTVEGIIKVTQPGLLCFNFAQNVAVANTTQILRGSSLIATIIQP